MGTFKAEEGTVGTLDPLLLIVTCCIATGGRVGVGAFDAPTFDATGTVCFISHGNILVQTLYKPNQY